MRNECAVIQYIKKAAGEEASQFSRSEDGIFTYVLNIISDIYEYGLTSTDVEVLHSFVDSICTDGHEVLLSLIQASTADCEICAALGARMEAKPVGALSK